MIERLKGLNLYLIGMMGAGKTTIGRRLATELGYRFFDTDAVIEQAAGQSIAEIFAAVGESEFRALETQVLAELSSYRRLVVATGGGIVLNRSNWSHLREGLVIWLDVPVTALFDRLKTDRSRPLLQTENPQQTLQTLLDARTPLYAQADLRISITAAEAPDLITSRILAAIPTVLKPDTPLPDLDIN
jgi:shikimate kinase